MVTHRQLAATGITGSALTRRVAAGRLQRVYRGVFAVGHFQRTREARWIAAVMACGRGAVLSHLDAAALWRIYESRRTKIHVTTSRSPRTLPGIRARARDAALTATGLRPLRFTWQRVTGDGEEVLAELKATLSGRR